MQPGNIPPALLSQQLIQFQSNTTPVHSYTHLSQASAASFYHHSSIFHVNLQPQSLSPLQAQGLMTYPTSTTLSTRPCAIVQPYVYSASPGPQRIQRQHYAQPHMPYSRPASSNRGELSFSGKAQRDIDTLREKNIFIAQLQKCHNFHAIVNCIEGYTKLAWLCNNLSVQNRLPFINQILSLMIDSKGSEPILLPEKLNRIITASLIQHEIINKSQSGSLYKVIALIVNIERHNQALSRQPVDNPALDQLFINALHHTLMKASQSGNRQCEWARFSEKRLLATVETMAFAVSRGLTEKHSTHSELKKMLEEQVIAGIKSLIQDRNMQSKQQYGKRIETMLNMLKNPSCRSGSDFKKSLEQL
ncbi:hypothetical protein [Endozoicomonas elysicola]|uniref:Uncharacterized protein n=1 Tax=Endozoicomonas elysicola TaxID=305900 RepID=A0A081KBG2_9GAMM|nr:hypothetical protein [Endozoicomonas elysicola]KEI71488.1 hypothetical protein GV64_12705 [Endozoicomonas elysicola]